MRTMQSSVRIAVGVLALLLLLLCNGCQRGVSEAKPASSVLQMETIPRTPKRLARGEYLVEGLLQCPFCHSDYDFTQRPARPVEGKKGGGNLFVNTEVELPEPNRW